MASRIESYIHSDNSTPGKGGSLIEVRCKTDFGAKTDEFAEFSKFAAKIAYGFQVTTWDELIELHPPVEDARKQLEEAIGEPISVPQISVMLPIHACKCGEPTLGDLDVCYDHAKLGADGEPCNPNK